MSDDPRADSEVILYQTEDGKSRLQARFSGETAWLLLNLACAQEIGWTCAPLDEAERRRGFDPAGVTPEEVLPQRNAKENAR